MKKGNAVLVLLAAVLLSGCFYSREISHVRHSVERAFPGSHFDQKIVVSLGSFWMRTSSWILGMTDDKDAENISDYLADIDRVKIGVYHTETLEAHNPNGEPAFRDLFKYGWEPAVQVSDEEGHVWVLYRSHGTRIGDAFIIVLDDEELVIARVSGHLDRLVQRAMQDYRPFRRIVSEAG